MHSVFLLCAPEVRPMGTCQTSALVVRSLPSDTVFPAPLLFSGLISLPELGPWQDYSETPPFFVQSGSLVSAGDNFYLGHSWTQDQATKSIREWSTSLVITAAVQQDWVLLPNTVLHTSPRHQEIGKRKHQTDLCLFNLASVEIGAMETVPFGKWPFLRLTPSSAVMSSSLIPLDSKAWGEIQ